MSLLASAVFVGGVVVHHQVQLAGGVGAGDLLEEGQELLVAVTRFFAALEIATGPGHPVR